jgi:flagellar protein FliS
MAFGFAPSAASAYAQVGLETGVSTADPHKLILMLFEGALLSIATATSAMERKDIPAKGQAISKAIEIINDGLKVSLDYEAGGELAERLGALYDYMTSRLLYANLNNSIPALEEVGRLLREIKGAWESIGTQV